MRSLPIHRRYPFTALVLFLLGGCFFALGFLWQGDRFSIGILLACVCWFSCLSSLAHWVAASAATSTSPVLRTVERIRSYIANEPASFEATPFREEKKL